jgi:hypothetical protein
VFTIQQGSINNAAGKVYRKPQPQSPRERPTDGPIEIISREFTNEKLTDDEVVGSGNWVVTNAK